MFDFFGHVICSKCKSQMRLNTVNRHTHETQAVFACTNPTCYDESATEWKSNRTVVFMQREVA